MLVKPAQMMTVWGVHHRDLAIAVIELLVQHLFFIVGAVSLHGIAGRAAGACPRTSTGGTLLNRKRYANIVKVARVSWTASGERATNWGKSQDSIQCV